MAYQDNQSSGKVSTAKKADAFNSRERRHGKRRTWILKISATSQLNSRLRCMGTHKTRF